MKSLIILFGAPGSGKGMLGDMLVQKMGITKIATGDILRAEVKNQTPLGQEIAPFIKAGQLVADDIVDPIVFKKIKELSDCAILDGYPRRFSQLETLKTLTEKGFWITTIHLTTPIAEIVERISRRRICRDCGKVNLAENEICSSCGGELIIRPDDANIEKRIKDYLVVTEPMLEEIFQLSNQFINVDGSNFEKAYSNVIRTLRVC